jgi:hypothetical protein
LMQIIKKTTIILTLTTAIGLFYFWFCNLKELLIHHFIHAGYVKYRTSNQTCSTRTTPNYSVYK